MPDLTVSEVAHEDLRLAWPLVRAAGPGMTLDEWLRYADLLAERGGGVIGVTGGGSALLGVATFETAETLHMGKVLKVDRLVSFELTRSAPVKTMLRGALDRIAPLLGCTAVLISANSRGYFAKLDRLQ